MSSPGSSSTGAGEVGVSVLIGAGSTLRRRAGEREVPSVADVRRRSAAGPTGTDGLKSAELLGATVEDCLAVEFEEAVRRRRMVRSFSPDGVDRAVLDGLLQAALRSPTAGNSGGTAWVVLEGPEETGVYWEATTDEAWRDPNRARFVGLSRAPVVPLSYASPGAYAARYAEPDKSDPRLAAGEWPVPYWFGDAAFAVMTVLLGAVTPGWAPGARPSGGRRSSPSASPCRRVGACSAPCRWGTPTATTTARRRSAGHNRAWPSGCTEAHGDNRHGLPGRA